MSRKILRILKLKSVICLLDIFVSTTTQKKLINGIQ